MLKSLTTCFKIISLCTVIFIPFCFPLESPLLYHSTLRQEGPESLLSGLLASIVNPLYSISSYSWQNNHQKMLMGPRHFSPQNTLLVENKILSVSKVYVIGWLPIMMTLLLTHFTLLLFSCMRFLDVTIELSNFWFPPTGLLLTQMGPSIHNSASISLPQKVFLGHPFQRMHPLAALFHPLLSHLILSLNVF